MLFRSYFEDAIAVHSIAPRVYYNSKSDTLTNVISDQTNPAYNQNADLLEVVFIELNKRDKIRNAVSLKSLLDVICDNTQKTETLKVLFNLNDEEVNAMLKQTSFVDDIKEEGKEEERSKIIKTMFSNGMSVEQISKALSMSEDIVKSYL